ncbi:hypothetical protein SynA1560_02418 [Synechococcus sp. A15-60]|nr:hypothetical protein SynA1560_02418 [Synechococcus sp. A15-60]
MHTLGTASCIALNASSVAIWGTARDSVVAAIRQPFSTLLIE